MCVVAAEVSRVGVVAMLILEEVVVSIVALVKWCVVGVLFCALGVGFCVERGHLL